jgi:protein-S-isoprenylcysteine O-methyltransferase Ste14
LNWARPKHSLEWTQRGVTPLACAIDVPLNSTVRRQRKCFRRNRRQTMFVLGRVVTYASLFIGLVLIYVPARLLSWSGIVAPAAIGVRQITGMVVGSAGALVALWSIFSFALIGRGTPAPFDPPRRLVIQGPYRFVRNPMYIGAAFVIAGEALFYESLVLQMYVGLFLLITHLFVIWYEEPTLRRTFGEEYEAYCLQIRRRWPKV